jgi:hypothetical protein
VEKNIRWPVHGLQQRRALKEGLAAVGFIDGQTIELEHRYTARLNNSSKLATVSEHSRSTGQR